MAALVSSRAMAQQPLHSFFTRQPPRKTAEAKTNLGLLNEGKGEKSGRRRKLECHDSGTGPEPDEAEAPQRKRQRTSSSERRPISRQSGRPRERDPDMVPKLSAGRTHKEPEEHLLDDEPWEPEQETRQPSERRQRASRESSQNRILKLRADGRLKSPDAAETPDREPNTRKRRARGKRGRRATIKYGKTPHDRIAFGRKIEQILAGKMRVTIDQFVKSSTQRESAASKAPEGPPKRAEVARATSKNTHPFFLAKTKPMTDTDNAEQTKSDTATSTSGATVNGEGIAAANKSARSAFPSSFGTSFAKPVKVAGSVEAMWPPREMQHLRGLPARTVSAVDSVKIPRDRERKAKGRKAVVNANDEVYGAQEVLVRSLKRALRKNKDNTSAANDVAKPMKHLITGMHLQRRLLVELQHHHESRPASAAAARTGFGITTTATHLQHRMSPAATFLYNQVQTSLSAFDRFECDSQDWCHKYAPKRVDHALQDQADLGLLRDWIRNRNVDQVETGAAQGQPKLSAAKQLAVKRRKRKIRDELDDFIASSDEDSYYGSEVTEPEGGAVHGLLADHEAGRSSVSNLKKLKPGNLQSTRAVLLSGPHGCGKTASVYAIAAELGFEVFEINSGMRRNGRDIMEKVGDMTRNHLVGNSGLSSIVKGSEELVPEVEIPSEEAIDPKQQSVASFFTAKPKIQQEKKRPKPRVAPKQTAKVEVPLKPKKHQKQSLILFEDVDVLFEEDKPFWTTVFTLVVQSRRPIIMTCTEEDRLPLADFVDTACLYLVPQSREDIVDYALCLAANEGHLISRGSALRALAIRKGDLRGTLTDLQFWCQMTIGDERAGSGWFMDASKAMLNRKDSEPRLRTVSEGSYPEDSTLFARTDNAHSPLETECRQLSEAFDFIGDDAFERDDWLLHASREKAHDLRNDLDTQDLRCDVLSLADILPLAPRQFELNDCSIPELDEKTRAEYQEGFSLLQIDPVVDHSGVAEDIRLTLRAASRRLTTHGQPPNPLMRADLITTALRPRNPLASQRQHVRHLAETSFEPLCDPPASTPWSQQLPAGISVFASPFSTIAVDVAPVLRAIARSDLQLEEERNRLNSLLVEPGRKTNRQRTTRAARAALEGGNKASTRRDRYLPKEVDYKAVLRTGGQDWAAIDAGGEIMSRAGSAAGTPSVEGSRRSQDDSDDELMM